MVKRILALVFIFIFTSLGWFILGGVTWNRTQQQDRKLRRSVGQLWGTVQKQKAPHVYYLTQKEQKNTKIQGSETIIETKMITVRHPVALEATDIKVAIKLKHRKKGLLWYPTYRVTFQGDYLIKNDSRGERNLYFEYEFPTAKGVYDNFSLSVNGKKIQQIVPIGDKIHEKIAIEPDQTGKIRVSYSSQGMDQWWYIFGEDVSYISNFKLTMMTNFSGINFPENSISPTEKVKKDNGWELTWKYSDLLSGVQIGMEMPEKINPGPFVSRITFFAPISLFLFLFLVFIITTLKPIKIHPMNYFFICAAFFSFHLLLAYLADHINIYAALALSSIVSIFLVISYMRLVTGARFAFLEIGGSQFIYLVIFSCTFFLKGYTGLAVTILSIITLFVIMQLTGKIDWSKSFARKERI
jgi:inner membrane protein involved in colicin E2 resistance